MNFKGKMQRKSGITLISLVVTIIVLLILAGVTISALSGDNGILTRTQEAKEKTDKSSQRENDILLDTEYEMNEYLEGNEPIYAMLYNTNETMNKIIVNIDNENQKIENIETSEAIPAYELVLQRSSNVDESKILVAQYELNETNTENIAPEWFQDGNYIYIYKVNIKDRIHPKTTAYWFYKMHNLVKIEGLEKLDMSKCISIQAMFNECCSLKDLNMTNWNTDELTNMIQTFYNCASLEKIDISNFNTSKVNTMRSCFSYCTSLKSLELGKIDTSQNEDFSFMFQNLTNIEYLDLSNLNILRGEEFKGMFQNSINLKSIDGIYNWNILPNSNTSNMFLNCPVEIPEWYIQMLE